MKSVQKQDVQVAGSFFHRMRKWFALLDPPKGSPETPMDEDGVLKLLAAEYAHSGIHRDKVEHKDAETFIHLLLAQCRPRVRDPGEKNFENWKSLNYTADAALLVSFLAAHGNKTAPKTREA